MNPRIKELAEQAHCYACEYARRPDYSPHNPYNESMYKQRYNSKFAELIVRECAQFCEDKNSKLLGTMLKEHFGVEEE
jgi:hypothetical protein